MITGGLYNASDDIALYFPNGTQFATVDADTNEVTVVPIYQDRMDLSVSFDQHIPLLHVYDNEIEQDRFVLHMVGEELLALPDMQSNSYQLQSLTGATMDNFDG